MFTMMNHAHLGVALQGVAHAARRPCSQLRGRAAPGPRARRRVCRDQHAEVARMIDDCDPLRPAPARPCPALHDFGSALAEERAFEPATTSDRYHSAGRRSSRLPPLDNDLIKNCAKTSNPIGERIIVHGRVLDENDRLIPKPLVEIWQANAGGRYRQKKDTYLAPIDPTSVPAAAR
jgi:hypothetical protein